MATAKEKNEKLFKGLCSTIANHPSYEILKARIYEGIEAGAVSGKYDPADRPAIDLGTFKAASLLFKILEDNSIAAETTTRTQSDEY